MIDQRLVDGEPVRTVASRYVPLSKTALQRHKDEHLPQALLQAQAAQEVAHADTLLDQVQDLHRRTLKILTAAEKSKDGRLALGAVREARSNLELLAKLTGELDERAQINVLLAPEWLQVRATLLMVLSPYPEARIAVAGALAALDAPARETV
jgi:hypothetical protein